MRGRVWAIATVRTAVIVFAAAVYLMTQDGSAAPPGTANAGTGSG